MLIFKNVHFVKVEAVPTFKIHHDDMTYEISYDKVILVIL
jgi:hypothetical protein